MKDKKDNYIESKLLSSQILAKYTDFTMLSYTFYSEAEDNKFYSNNFTSNTFKEIIKCLKSKH